MAIFCYTPHTHAHIHRYIFNKRVPRHAFSGNANIYLTGENLVVWAEFSTLCLAALLYCTASGWCTYAWSWKLGPGFALSAKVCPWLDRPDALLFVLGPVPGVDISELKPLKLDAKQVGQGLKDITIMGCAVSVTATVAYYYLEGALTSESTSEENCHNNRYASARISSSHRVWRP
jgi:hypothetical protein